nr:MAG TPA: hypothetical protein [Caudoviricetes sp.]
MRIVLEIDPVQMVVLTRRSGISSCGSWHSRSASHPSKILRRRTLRSWLIWLARTSKLSSVVARPGVRRT